MKTVFVDVDTQIDFLYPAGALYVPGAESIVDRVAALNRYAASHGVPLISTMDAHTENDPEFRSWPPHCVVDTAGQRKPAATLTEPRQIVLEKQSLNCFDSPQMAPLLERLGAERYVVYGVVTEICVKIAAEGLLKTGRRVELVTDAVKELDAAARDRFLAEFTAAGGVLTDSREVMAGVR